MFNGKLKAITFSYDDGITQDIRLVELFDKYGLKGTFNLNSELAGTTGRISADKIVDTYRNHEVAVHTLTHPSLINLDNDGVVRQIEQDRINLEKLVGYPVQGMAYPYAATNERVVEVIKNETKILYARTADSTYNFELQTDLLNFKPTIYQCERDKMFELAYEFLELKPDYPKLFYIWGHAYEFDKECYGISWEQMEEFCKLISGRDDIFYGTNKEVLL